MIVDAHLFGSGQERTDDVLRSLDEAGIAISSSHSNAMPFAVMEAMASGLPVVAWSGPRPRRNASARCTKRGGRCGRRMAP